MRRPAENGRQSVEVSNRPPDVLNPFQQKVRTLIKCILAVRDGTNETAVAQAKVTLKGLRGDGRKLYEKLKNEGTEELQQMLANMRIFGICQECKTGIHLGRILALPTAETCINCARNGEEHENDASGEGFPGWEAPARGMISNLKNSGDN